ncbi:MAG: 2Fe-2S iron-sulfur cluster-binding protein [Polaromonas sp.]
MTTPISPHGAPSTCSTPGPTRRAAIQRTAASVAALSASAHAQLPAAPTPAPTPTRTRPMSHLLTTRLVVNGQAHELVADSRTTLLDALREHLDLKGSKKGCDHGQCGACTVLVEGRRINACLSLAAMHDGQAITTIEGLSTPAASPAKAPTTLHALQAAFLKHDGFQCGYCTPGQICSAAGMLAEVKLGMPSHVSASLNGPLPPLTDEEIRERMSGNICRCSAYPLIAAAIRDVAQQPGAAT